MHSQWTVDGWTVLKGQPTAIRNLNTASVDVKQKGFLQRVWITAQAFKNMGLFFGGTAHLLMLKSHILDASVFPQESQIIKKGGSVLLFPL